MIGRLCAAALLCAVMGALLSEYGWKGKRAFSALCVLLVLSAALPELAEIFDRTDSLITVTGISEVSVTALKIIGAGYAFGLVGDLCSELGETGIARCCAAVGRVEIFLLVLPYFEELILSAVRLIG